MTRHALVVGISQYPHIGSLQQPPIDAEKVAQILETHGEYIVTRLPACWDETTQNYAIDPNQIVNDTDLALALKKLLIELPENGASIEALIYFAGHGFTFSSNMGVEKGAIATSNTKITMQNQQVIEYENAVSFSDLNDVIQKSNLQSLILILDCCHSGYFIEKEMTKKNLYSAFIDDHRNYYCISACQTREKSLVLMGDEHSIFSTAVINGLQPAQANQNGKITGDRLYDYIQSELTVKGPKFGQTAIKMGWGEAINILSYPEHQIKLPANIDFNADNPYLGLYAFNIKDEPYFHGRQRAIQSLISRLDRNRFLAVIGSSGCGKSSLIKAGLLPELQRDRVVGSKDWQIATMNPGDRPLDLLLEKLEHLQQYQNTLLFIDQCEEIFTLCKDRQERQRFFQLIAQEASSPQRLSRVLVAIRGDFLDQCAEFSPVAKLINRVQPTTYCVEALNLEELILAIEEPAKLNGVSLEPGLAGAIAHDVISQAGALPLLQYALRELWQVCITDHQQPQNILTWSSYQQIGGVAGALSRRANNIYNSLTETEKQLMQTLFLELAEIGDGTTVTKRSVQRDILVSENPDLPKIIDDLTKHRLIAITERKDTDNNYVAYIELAHESLFEKWDLLKNWIEGDRYNLRLKRKFQNDCQDWLNKYQRTTDALLTGAWLSTVEEWITTYQPQLSDAQQEFFHLSINRRDEEKREKEEKQRQLLEIAEAQAQAEAERARAIAGELRAIEAQLQAESEKVQEQKAKIRVQRQRGIIATILGSIISVFAIYTWQSSLITNTILWTERATNYYDKGNQLEAMMASVKALNYLRGVIYKGNYLNDLNLLTSQIREKNRIKLNSDIMAIDLNDNHDQIAIGTANGTIELWKIEGSSVSKQSISSVRKSNNNYEVSSQEDSISSVNLSHNNQFLASASLNGKINLKQIKDNKLLNFFSLLKVSNIPILDIDFSNDDQFLATSTNNGQIKIWEKIGSKYQAKDVYISPISNQKYIATLTFSPFEKSIIFYGDYLGNIVQWNRDEKNSKNFKILKKFKDSIADMKFSKTGQYLATVSLGGEIGIWQCRKYLCEIIVDTSITDEVLYSVSFNNNEKFLAIASGNGTIYLWDFEKFIKSSGSEQPITLSGHANIITGLVFAKEFLISVSVDKTMRIWDFELNKNLPKDLLKYSCHFLQDYLQSQNQNTFSDIPKWFNSKNYCIE